MNRLVAYVWIAAAIICGIVILMGIVAVMGIVAGAHGSVQGSASTDVYPRWANLDDYQARILTVDTQLINPHCTSGVIWLGSDRYRVPVGVAEFWCEEGK